MPGTDPGWSAVSWLALSLTAFQSFLGVIKTQSPRKTIPWFSRRLKPASPIPGAHVVCGAMPGTGDSGCL
eukprot:1275313-Rhodomonas_salina.1